MFAGQKLLIIAGLATLASSCASYKPEPISATESAAALENRTLDDPRLRQFIEFALSHEGASDAAAAWDLGMLTLTALYYHPDLDIARAKLAAARAGVVTAKQVPNPSLGLALTYNSSVTTPSPWRIGPMINFIIEALGRREYRTAQAQALSQAAREDLATAGWQLRGRVRTGLLDLWAAEQRLRYASDRLQLQDQLTDLLERRFAVGEASSLDVTRERINRNQASLALRDAQRQRDDARVQLATAIGVPVRALDRVSVALDTFDKPVQIEGDAATSSLRRRALVERTDVQGLLAEYEAAQSGLRFQVTSQYPNLTLGPGYTYDQGNLKYNLGIGAELPIFNQNQGPIAEAAARRRDVAARFVALQAKVIGAIDSAASSYRAATQALSTADALLNGAETRERRIARSFDAGQVDRPTLVTAQLELAAIRLSRLDALTQQRQAVGALEDAFQQPLYEPGRWPVVPEDNPRISGWGPPS